MAQRFGKLKKSGIASDNQKKGSAKNFTKTKREIEKQNPSSLA